MEAVAQNFSPNVPPKQNPPKNFPIQEHPQAQQFLSYLEAPEVSPRARIFCEILTRSPPQDVEAALSSLGIKPGPEVVEEVLKLSYGSPAGAVKFFRWAGLSSQHSAYAWNLMIDLLGKNGLFDPMWDAVRSMKQEGVLSMATFVSIFGSYCAAGRTNEAIMTFDVMDRYGIQPNVVAVNSLLSSICRENNGTVKALEFFERIKTKIMPDADSFAILLEGWEKEGNAAKAKHTFGEMVIRVGWSPQYMSAYHAFLTTLVRASQADDAIKFLQVMKGKNCLPGLKLFSNALDILVKQNDLRNAVPLWDTMVGSGLVPNLIMCNAMIGLLCKNDDIDNAFRFLDEMVFYGAFPDSLAYNVIFKCLIKNKKVRETAKFFNEMVKNEWPPTHLNCAAAISLLFEGDDPETAIEIWIFMVKNDISPMDDSANSLLIGFCNLSRLTELRRFAENMLDRKIKIYESTMVRMKNAFYKEGRSAHDAYDSIARKWKSS